jgi:hypothetical protein
MEKTAILRCCKSHDETAGQVRVFSFREIIPDQCASLGFEEIERRHTQFEAGWDGFSTNEVAQPSSSMAMTPERCNFSRLLTA